MQPIDTKLSDITVPGVIRLIREVAVVVFLLTYA